MSEDVAQLQTRQEMMTQPQKSPLSVLPLLASGVAIALSSLAIEKVAMAREPEVKEDYDTRWRKLPKRSTVRPADPNVYVYNAKFARNFMMPPEWSSTELRNVDAVAMRVVADYGSCSWDDTRRGCERVPLRCEIDLYFDHSDHALPWHAEAPEFWDSNYWSSSHFLRKALNKVNKKKHIELASPSALPFVDHRSGKPMLWSRLSSDLSQGARRMDLLSYDRIALTSTARVSLAGRCDEPPAMLVLAPVGSTGPGQIHDLWRIALPQPWQDRLSQALLDAEAEAKLASTSTPRK
jgi:hypothetical protein